MPTQVLIIHGGETFRTPEDCLVYLKREELTLDMFQRKGWKSGLGEALGEKFSVIAPRMPNKENARYEEWAVWFEKVLKLLEKDILLVGHSLGGTFLVKYLSENQLSKKIGASFLIAPCYDDGNTDGDEREYLGSFLPPKDKSMFLKQAGQVFLYHSQDDPVVPFSNFEDYKKEFPEAESKEFSDRGHFLDEEFPELIEDIRSLA